ncbi:hypothetical protein D3C74_325880 [compost metagenome]
MELLAPTKTVQEKEEAPKISHSTEQEWAELMAALALWKNDSERKAEYIVDLEGKLSKAREKIENMQNHSEKQIAEISRLMDVISGSAVFADQAGARISELEEENTRLKQELATTGQTSKVVTPVFGPSVTLHVPVTVGTDPNLERLNVYRSLDSLGGTFEAAGLDRERIMRELFELMQIVVGFVATDLSELMPDQDVTEHVQRLFLNHNERHIQIVTSKQQAG